MKTLLQKAGIILYCTVILSLYLDATYRRAYGERYEIPQNIFMPSEQTDKFMLVKLGNSHAEYGLDFTRYNIPSLSLARSAQPFSYDLASLRMYKNQIGRGAVILISVSPMSFSKKSDFQDGFQDVYYDGRLSPFLIPNLNINDYLLNRLIPFFNAGYLFRRKYAESLQPTATEEPGKPAKKEHLYAVEAIRSELTDPTIASEDKLNAGVPYMVYKWTKADAFQRVIEERNRTDLGRIIAFCRQQEWIPVLVSIPVSQALWAGLPADYMRTNVYDNLAKIELQDAPYFDFFNYRAITTHPNLFEDPDHLNRRGAALFSYVLLQQLIEKHILPKYVDNYNYSLPINAEK